MAEIERAESHGADLAVFGPVFGKQAGGKQAGGKQSGGKQSSGKHGGAPEAAGLAGLREICDRPVAGAARMPVLALGGISVENAAACLACGAAGVAGIRLFQANDPGSVVMQLRKSEANAAESRSERGEVSHPYWPARKHSK